MRFSRLFKPVHVPHVWKKKKKKKEEESSTTTSDKDDKKVKASDDKEEDKVKASGDTEENKVKEESVAGKLKEHDHELVNVMGKPTIWIFDQVRIKQVCTVTEAGVRKLEILDLRRGIVLSV